MIAKGITTKDNYKKSHLQNKVIKLVFDLISGRISQSLHMNLYLFFTSSEKADDRWPGKTVAPFIKVHRGVFSERGHRDLQGEEAEKQDAETD